MAEEAAAEHGPKEEDEDQDPGSKTPEQKRPVAVETASAPVYCLCRKPDINCFMIGCDSCAEWFHGDCIGISEKAAKPIRVWYCPSCREKDPSLEIKYRPKKLKEKEPGQETLDNEEFPQPPSNMDKRRGSQQVM
ncbi:CXXC-type zinc finger protein 1-like [Boleophthalmus pectinirostris]|uniref:CXXC-type zinc finger protein 1-like n=1 Tax=Boleophthalmus pectinirostris TaxID=150288 RepID=UPI00242FB79E|nr:CXXC-type zinc finger protein 1-like [Boleophthalmus pectinirostris]